MTTASSLSANKTASVAFSLCFEGLPFVWCTGDADTMATAFAAVTDFADADFYTGLHIIGEMGGSISPFDPSIKPDTLDFTITEKIPTNSSLSGVAGILASTFLKAGHAQTTRTLVRASVDADELTIPVLNSSVLTAAPAFAHIGNECIYYTSKTAGGSHTVVCPTGGRGRYALHTTNGGDRFSTAHEIGTDNGLMPQISNSPRSEHFGRQVMLRVHHIDPLTGVYDTVANAMTLWVGRIKSYRWNGDGTVTFSCEHVIGLLKEGQIFSNQFRAEVAPGQWVSERETRICFMELAATDTITFENFTAAAQMQAGAVRELLTFEANALKVATTLAYDYAWWADAIRCTGTFAVGVRILVALNPEVWDLLGYATDGATWVDNSTATPYRLMTKELTRISSTEYRLERDFEAVAYKFKLGIGSPIVLENARGTWVNQPTIPDGLYPAAPSTTEGFVQVGDVGVCAIKYTSATSIESTGDYSNYFGSKGISTNSGDLESGVGTLVIRGDGPQRPVVVKQLWWEKGNAAKILLKFLLSTGVTNFNHASWDRLPYGMGLGIPASLLNIPSFQSLVDLDSSFILTGPEKFVNYFESQLAVAGKYCVWQDGKIALRPMALQSGSITPAITLTESNKASADPADLQRLQVDYSSDGLINRVVLEYNRLADGTFLDKLSVEDSVSVSDFGARKSLAIKGWSVGDVGEANAWINNVAASVLTWWSRPLARARRTFTFQEIGYGIACGDQVTITDSGMIDPATGLHGVTNMPACVVGWTYDWKTGVGVAELILMPELNASRLAAWAPTARISSYVAATKVITCVANQYSHSSEAADATHFDVGDMIRMVSLSPANPAAPGNYRGEVAAQSGNTVTLVNDPTAGAGLTGTYNLQFDEIATAVAAQKTLSYIADDANDSTGDAASDSYKYGSDVDNPSTITFGSVDYDQRFVRIADIADNTAEPFSVGDYHDATKSLNCLLGRVTNTAPITEYFETAPTQTGTTYRLVYSNWIPCMGEGRGLIVAIRGYHSTAGSSASFKVTLGNEMVGGSSLTATDYSGAVETSTVTTASTTVKALGEITFATTYPGISGALPSGLWLTVEIKAGAGGETATLVGLDVREVRL